MMLLVDVGVDAWMVQGGSLLKLGPIGEQEVECQRPGMIKQGEEHAMAYLYPCGLPFWTLYFMPAREIRKENVH